MAPSKPSETILDGLILSYKKNAMRTLLDSPRKITDFNDAFLRDLLLVLRHGKAIEYWSSGERAQGESLASHVFVKIGSRILILERVFDTLRYSRREESSKHKNIFDLDERYVDYVMNFYEGKRVVLFLTSRLPLSGTMDGGNKNTEEEQYDPHRATSGFREIFEEIRTKTTETASTKECSRKHSSRRRYGTVR